MGHRIFKPEFVLFLGLMSGTSWSQAPVITALEPPSAAAGSPSFTLRVTGKGFTADSVMLFDGATRATQLLAADPDMPGLRTLTATIPDFQVSSMREVKVTVVNGASTSDPVPFVAYGVLNVKANDLAFDPYQRRLLVSAAADSPTRANEILLLDPETLQVTASIAAGLDPGKMALSADGSTLYVGMSGDSSLYRINVLDRSVAKVIPLPGDVGLSGAVTVQALATVGASDDTVILATKQGFTLLGVAVYDDGKRLPLALDRSANVGANVLTLSGANRLYTDVNLSSIDIDGNGLTLSGQVVGRNLSPHGLIFVAPHLISADGNAYLEGSLSDAPTTFADPLQPALPGQPPLQGKSIRADASLQRVLFLSSFTNSSGGAYVQIFDGPSQRLYGRITIANVSPGGGLVRWNEDGIAFLDNGGRPVLARTLQMAEKTDNPVPDLTSTDAAEIEQQSTNEAIAVHGTDFVRGSVVQWNGQARTTIYDSDTRLTALIPASDLAAPGTAELSVFNPEPGGGTSGALQVVITPPAPRLSLPPALDFGSLWVGTSLTQRVSITNTGTGDFHVSRLDLPEDFAVLAACPRVIAPATSCFYDLNFVPTSAAVRDGDLVLHDDVLGVSASISLKATGIDFTVNLVRPLRPRRDGNASAALEAVVRGPAGARAQLSCSASEGSCSVSPARLLLTWAGDHIKLTITRRAKRLGSTSGRGSITAKVGGEVRTIPFGP